MSAPDLLSALLARGVTLWRDGGVLRHRAPRGAVTPELLAELKAHKAELLATLAATKPAEARSTDTHTLDTPGEIPTPADAENLLERYTERAAIQEHDGGLPRYEAETQARQAVFQGRHAYHFKLAAFPDESPVYLSTTARGATEARRELEARFGAGRVLGCWPAGEPRPAVPPVSGQEGGR